MSICGCFSPNPRLGKNNSFHDEAEPPELAFTDKQNRFSQDVLTGLRGMAAPTTAVSCERSPASTFAAFYTQRQLAEWHMCSNVASCMHAIYSL